jgi:hypothetical protein
MLQREEQPLDAGTETHRRGRPAAERFIEPVVPAAAGHFDICASGSSRIISKAVRV